MKSIFEKSKAKIWDKLTDEQKREILLSYEESESDNHLLDHDSVMNKFKNWL